MFENYCVVDVETSGLSSDTDKVIEIACVFKRNGQLFYASEFVYPGVTIPPEVSGINHITDNDVKDARTIDQILNEPTFPKGYVIAHNAKFDRAFLPQLATRQWLCTYRCALHIWPDAPNHKNMVLKYYLGLNVDIPYGLAPHRALADSLVTEAIFQEMLKTHSIEELYELQSQPILQRRMKFGKYRGHEWKNIPKDYMQWMIKQPEDETSGIDSDVRFTIRYHLNA